jgi:membrane protein
VIEERIKYFLAFFSFVFSRYSQNRCSSIAAELTVTSLLALVPLTAVVFALLAFIPSFQDLGEQLQTILFQYFVPSTGETVQSYINEFVGKARGLSGVGTLMLLVTALLLMRTIDSSFNKIWQVQSNQSMVRTFLVYWAVLTLGPILLGSSLLITSYIKSLPMISDVVSGYGQWFTLWLPFLMACLAFSVMFYVIPNRKIPVSHAFLSGVVTASLFEVAKWAFGVFVSSFSTYQLIFGALAAVPLFLIWIYLSWGIVLLGAEFCHALDAFEWTNAIERQHPMIEVVSLMLVLTQLQKAGKTFDENNLDEYSPEGKKSINFDWLERLAEYGLVAKCQDQSYCLVKSSENIEFLPLYEVAGRLYPDTDAIDASDLPVEIKRQLHQLGEQLGSLFAQKLVN